MFGGEDLARFVDQATWVAVNDYEWQLLQQKTGWTAETSPQRVEALIVTRGATARRSIRREAHRDSGATAKAVVDPTGCGDAYRAGSSTDCCTGWTGRPPASIASLLGAIKIESLGTQNHKFTPAEFQQRLTAAFPRS